MRTVSQCDSWGYYEGGRLRIRFFEYEKSVYEQREPNNIASCSMDEWRFVRQLPVGADIDLQNRGKGGGENRGKRQRES